MRLVTFSEKGNRKFRVGALISRDGHQVVIDLSRVDPSLPRTMRELLSAADGDFKPLAARLGAAPHDSFLRIEDVVLGPVVPNAEKVICIGLNYRDHALETGQALPETPTVFAKFPNTLLGTGGSIIVPPNTTQVDYEAELAFVIGRRARAIGEEDAMNYVAGYTVFNDVSARDYQFRTSQWTLGKSFDTFAPCGPALVTRDEVPDPHALRITLRIGEEVLQDSNTQNLVFRIPQLVSHLSSVMTLEPGDVVATGTPGGVGFTRKPPRFLQPGDTVRVEIEGLGILENNIQAAAANDLPYRSLYSI